MSSVYAPGPLSKVMATFFGVTFGFSVTVISHEQASVPLSFCAVMVVCPAFRANSRPSCTETVVSSALVHTNASPAGSPVCASTVS